MFKLWVGTRNTCADILCIDMRITPDQQHTSFPPRENNATSALNPASQTSGSYPHTTLKQCFATRNDVRYSPPHPEPPIVIIIKSSPPSHDPTTPNAQLKPSPFTARVPADLDPRGANFAKPLVAQIRLRVSAARTEPFWGATWKTVQVRYARWAAWLEGGKVGAC